MNTKAENIPQKCWNNAKSSTENIIENKAEHCKNFTLDKFIKLIYFYNYNNILNSLLASLEFLLLKLWKDNLHSTRVSTLQSNIRNYFQRAFT